jgi:prepilin-type N-terminal cleavage/methylation domain-containing protein
MKFAPLLRTNRRRRSRRAFTLIEVLAALLLMAIVIPVAMQGMSIASRAGLLGQRKAAAMRVAERMINELIVTGEMNQSSSSGTVVDGDVSYPWTMQSEPWTEDSMTQVTVKVTFSLQGNSYDVSASTLYDATAGTAGATGSLTL